MSALLLNLLACQSLWSVPSRCSLSLVESILRDPGAVSLTGRKGTENVFKHFRRAWKLTENFRRAFSPGPTDCPWVSEDASRMTICESSACSKQLPVFLIFHSEVMGRNNGKWVPIFMQLSPGSEKSGSPTPWRSGYHFYLFRAEKRSAQASAHPLSQAQGGLFCVLTTVCLFVTERVLTKTDYNIARKFA